MINAPTAAPDARLERLLGGPALAALRQRLRRHLERRGGSEEARAGLQLRQLAPAESEALAQLTGRRVGSSRTARIDVAALDASLQAAGVAASLREALERLDGPIVDRAALRDAARAAWQAVVAPAERDPRLQHWLQTPAASTLLKRLARQDATVAAALAARADSVLRRLPARGVPRAQLAAQALGNAHALDRGQPVATIVLAAWRAAEAQDASAVDRDPPDPALAPADAPADPPADDERERDVWARAGVLVNELARPVLLLNLPVAGGAVVAGSPGEPAYLSLRRLLRTPPAWAVDGVRVFVCENPNLLAIAADRLGAAAAPLVCTDGMPAAAQRTLLTQLRQAGARLAFHGDFDGPGVRIANHVLRTWQAVPWRMAAGDYVRAAATAPHAGRDLPDVDTPADWDPALAAAMREHGLAIAEEAVADGLIDDLRR